MDATRDPMMRYDAIVLTGGRARRLDGADKPAITIGSRTLLDFALDAAAEARSTVVVGPPTSAHPAERTVREDPPGGGPVAAVAAGLAHLSDPEPYVMVLACDVPGAKYAMPYLVRALEDTTYDGAIALDDDGREQPLLALYRTAALVAALGGLDAVANASMRAVLDQLWLEREFVPWGTARDADTWEDVEALRKEWA